MEVIWKDIDGYNGAYKVSNTGHIKSFVCIEPKILKSNPNKGGYHSVSLSQSGGRKGVFVHVQVALSFIGDRPLGLDVDHIDGNPANNHLSNLQYITRGENIAKGRLCKFNYEKGSAHVGVKLNKSGTWLSRRVFNGVLYQVGTFSTESEAYDAYENATEEKCLAKKNVVASFISVSDGDYSEHDRLVKYYQGLGVIF